MTLVRPSAYLDAYIELADPRPDAPYPFVAPRRNAGGAEVHLGL